MSGRSQGDGGSTDEGEEDGEEDVLGEGGKDEEDWRARGAHRAGCAGPAA